MEGTHGKLCARLADGLRRDDTHSIPSSGQSTIAQVASVTGRADAVWRHALEHRAAVDLSDAGGDHRVHHILIQLGANRQSLEARHRRRQDAPEQAIAKWL